jgi:16S rRNA (adenine1518-N6/adenine1519-N6)-dimethyltransferase
MPTAARTGLMRLQYTCLHFGGNQSLADIPLRKVISMTKTKGEIVATIEVDIDVALNFLERQFPDGTHHRQNFLKAEPAPYDVILGNLPYYMTTEILEKIYKDLSVFKTAVLMVQKEVMPRLVATVGEEGYGPLAIFLGTLGTITPILEVSPVSFFPEPHVQSIIFQLQTLPKGVLVPTRPFFYFIKKIFLHRRKTILNNLMGIMTHRDQAEALLKEVNLSPNARPETISVNEYITLFKRVSKEKTL